MKKFTLFMTMFIAFAMTAFAQVDTSKEYRIQDVATGNYLNAGNYNAHADGTNGGVNVVAFADSDDQVFTFEESGNGYKIKTKSGYYIYCQKWNVDALAEGSVITLEDAGENVFHLKCDKGYFKVEAVGGTYYPFCDAALGAAATWTLEEVATVEPEPEPELPTLEITGYTPTEAVESLKEITVTFNDEIEGTFDIMAMDQIYVGSRSNGAEFTVEGNVLNITLFNAITTPGEYGLVIPEGLITRKANGEKISLNKEITFEVKAPLAALEITGYTPAEAVESLKEITVTFNDEIEGTFDIMAMDQIYVGSRSNGAEFTVEGNVLNITLFNAITTPGEYGLVIPEGLITRKANGEKISSNKEIVFEVKEATVVEPEPEVKTIAIYQITAKDAARGALYATAENTHLTHCGATYGNYHNRDIAVNAEDVNQQFVFVEYEGYTYLYSLGAQKFAVREAQYIKLVENPEGYVTVVDADVEGYKLIKFNGQNRLNFSGGYEHGCVANYETPDDGNRLALTEVGQYDATELVASIEAYFQAKNDALVIARAAFDAKYAQAEAILAEANLSVVDSELPLQVADATAAAYVWSNNPEPSEGPIAQLVDGVAEEGNFFHTNWHGGGEEPHYIEVDLGEGNELASFSFKYTTRFAVMNDYPDAIQVMGSNDKETYTELYSVTNGLPQTGGTQWASNIISSETAYRYLRFNIDAERTYWHMSEFDIITSEIAVAEKYAAVANSIVALDKAVKAAAENADYTAEQLYAAIDAINAALAEINKDENTVALIATANELIALEGIGYPAAAPRAELQAAIDAAVAMPDTENGTALQAAINAYYAATDVVLPEAGKAYTFKAVYGNNKFYIYNNNGTLAVAACGDEELPESAKFICEYDSEDDYMFQFKTADGAYYLAYPTLGGKNWLDGESVTGLEAESAQVTKFNINKILAGGNVSAQNSALFGLVKLDGYRGYDNGKYKDCYGPIVVKHSALTFDGADAPFYNANFTSAFCVEETEIVVEPLTVVAVTPAEAVESLQTITIEFDAEIAVDEANVNACTIDYGWGVTIGTTATVEGNVLKLVAFSPIKDKGQYPLTIPAGVVTRASDGVAYEGGVFTFEVKEKEKEPLAVVKVTPEAEVEKLDVITIEFNYNMSVNAMSAVVATIANADNSISYTFNTMDDIKYDGKVITFNLGENAITASGEYTLTIPSGLISATDGTKYTGTHTFTVVAPAAPETFAVEAFLFPAPQGEVTKISGIRVEANQGQLLSALPTGWTFTNEAGKEFDMKIEWLYDYETILIMFNPAIEEAGTYTLNIPAGSLKTDDGKECEAATFEFTIGIPIGIDGIEAEGEQTIYDLTGRKIETITKGGIYIVNGKKVMVK